MQKSSKGFLALLFNEVLRYQQIFWRHYKKHK